MDLIAELEAEQIASLGKDIPDFKAGDTIRVGYKVTEGTRTRVQNYEGVCIARKNGSGIAGSFTVRKISFGEGVERVFPLHSTNIDSITVVRRGRVRRAKLLRPDEHHRGGVRDHPCFHHACPLPLLNLQDGHYQEGSHSGHCLGHCWLPGCCAIGG